jgi:hypothetical protein
MSGSDDGGGESQWTEENSESAMNKTKQPVMNGADVSRSHSVDIAIPANIR